VVAVADRGAARRVRGAVELESQLGLKINGINAARAGNDGLHSLLILVGKVLPLKPDYVVLMEATNDIGPLSHGTYWQTTGSKRVIDIQKISVEQAIRILTTAVIPYTADIVSRAWRRVKGAHMDPEGGDSGTAGPERSRQDMGRDFTSMLTSFVHVARAWGIKPVLMTQVHVRPTSSAERQSTFLTREQVNGTLVDPESFASDHDYFNAIIRDVAHSEKVMLIDLARASDWKFGDVYDSIHLTDQGSRKVADVVAAAFRSELSSGLSQKPPEPRGHGPARVAPIARRGILSARRVGRQQTRPSLGLEALMLYAFLCYSNEAAVCSWKKGEDDAVRSSERGGRKKPRPRCQIDPGPFVLGT